MIQVLIDHFASPGSLIGLDGEIHNSIICKRSYVALYSFRHAIYIHEENCGNITTIILSRPAEFMD